MAKLTKREAKKLVGDASKKLRKVYVELGMTVFMAPRYEKKLMEAMNNLQAVYLHAFNSLK